MSASHPSDAQAHGPVRRFTRFAAVGALAAAGGLHLAALPGHLSESGVAGTFFAVTAAAQLLGSVLVATRPSTRTILAVVIGNLAVLTLWAMSRTTGLPTGGELGVREPFGVLDGAAAAAELLVVVAGLTSLAGHAPTAGRRSGDWRLGLALALTWVLSGGAGLAVADEGHHHGGGHDHSAPAAADHSHREPDANQPAVPPPSQAVDLSRPVAEDDCPAGHDCSDHSH